MVEEAISFWTQIQRYEDLLATDPLSYCFAPLSELYRKLGLLDDAISVAQKGCDLHPDYPGGFFALGAAYCDKGLKQEARAALERVVLVNPDNLRAQKLLGQLYVEAGEIALAQKALGQVLLQNPDDTESSLLLRSVAPAAAGSPPDEEYLQEAELVEELTDVFEELTEVFEERQEPQAWESPRVAERADSQEFVSPPPSQDPLTTATLAELYVAQGFPEKALAVYRELLSADPSRQSYRLRCSELTELRERQTEEAPGAMPPTCPEPPALRPDAEIELSRWLENIRRRKDGV